ncbi:unnamed protein product [Laminaria digitata]
MRIKVELDGGVQLLWSTPVLQRQFPDATEVNARLAEIVRSRETADTGIGKSVVGGWHSREDVMAWPDPEIGVLRDCIVEAVEALMLPTTGKDGSSLRASGTISAWANILRNGGYHRMHTHPGCVWSGVYYIETGTPAADHPTSGRLELYDPRTAVEMMALPETPFGQPVLIDPKPGMMVVFPSWLRHMVHPFVGEGERMTIAWNMLLDSSISD